MSESAIEWTDATWNPVTGCSKVSPGCAHCYAESLTLRFATVWKAPHLPWTPANAAENVILHPERLEQPLRWREPRMVFVNSMSDLFHEEIPEEYIAAIWSVMGRCPQHTFQILTKRPERIHEMLNAPLWGSMATVLPNVWLGTSIENRRFVHRADLLRQTPAAVRFISAEPLLGPLVNIGERIDDSLGTDEWSDGHIGADLDLSGIDWLIVGGESGLRHRPCNPAWVQALCLVATETGTAFFFKQWGGRTPKANGRELDGRTWDEYPHTREALAA